MLRLLFGVIVAAVVATTALTLINRDPEPTASAHVAIAPGPSARGTAGKVVGTSMTAQQAADAAIEDGKHPDLVPLPEAAFDKPIAAYRRYAVGQARRLIAAADRHDFDAAFDRWMLIGAAYGALGDLDLTEALEARDWHALSVGARKLPKALATRELAPVDYVIRAHEILEDVERDRMGEAVGVRAVADGVAATRAVMATLHDVLAGRGDALQTVDARLTRLEDTLAAIRRARGEWPAPDRLPAALRQRLLGQLGAALEALANVPGALETSLPPKLATLR